MDQRLVAEAHAFGGRRRHGDRSGSAGASNEGIQYGGFAGVMWLRHITPFRVAAVVVLIIYVSEMIVEGMWFSNVNGEGITVLEFLFIPLVLLFIDLVMHGFDVKPRLLFLTQISLLALIFWVW